MTSSYGYPDDASFLDKNDYIDFLRRNMIIVQDNSPVHSTQKAHHYLPRIGIYRFHQYVIPFQRASITLKRPKYGIDDVLSLYKFDRHLRLLSLDALERVEISLKSFMNTELCEMYGDDWFIKRKTCVPAKLKSSIISNIKRHPDVKKSENDRQKIRISDILNVFKKEAVMDTLSFGDSSQLYKYIPNKNQESIAQMFELPPKVLASWLRSLTYVRNVSAHHGRLWNVQFRTKPRLTRKILIEMKRFSTPANFNSRYFAQATITYFLLKRIARQTSWHRRLYKLMNDGDFMPTGFDRLNYMGFPEQWGEMMIWDDACGEIV